MKNLNPLVSIIIRTFNRPILLMGAIKSIVKQTYRPIEIILVNDGGSLPFLIEIQEILKNIKFKYINLKENKGRANAANVGIKNVSGEFIGFLDDDDELLDNHLSVLMEILRAGKYKIAYTDSVVVFKEFDNKKNRMRVIKRELADSEEFNLYKLFYANYIPLPSLLFKSETIVESGGFDPEFEFCEDWDLLIRMAKRNNFYHIKKATNIVNKWDNESQMSFYDKDFNVPLKYQEETKKACMQIITKHLNEYNNEVLIYFMSEIFILKQRLKKLKNQMCIYFFLRNIVKLIGNKWKQLSISFIKRFMLLYKLLSKSGKIFKSLRKK